METTDFFDDEVVADSEEEFDPNMTMDRNLGVPGYGIDPTSSVSVFATVGYPQAKTFSAISEFTGDTPARPANNLPQDVSGESSHRRPGQADTSTSSINNNFTDFEGMSIPGNIADRAKMRQRTQKKPLADTSDVIELSSDDDDEIGLKPSTSKTRPTPKPKAKSKAKQKAKEISSEDAETSNVSTKSSVPSKPRPRPVPIRKRPVEPTPAASTPGPELPIATSPPRMPQPNQRARSHPESQLPPSDPPMSTFRTEHSKENDTVLPRIETLSKFGPGGPLSSPSSLFSDAGPTSTKKRSGRSADSDAEIDELAPSDEGPVGYYQSERSLLLRQMPPPPTFFAGSSSLPVEGDVSGGNVLTANPDPQHDVVDLTDLPPTMVPTNTKSKAPSKPKKPKKKQSLNHDEYDDISAPMIILDEDEQDDDFDPTGDGEKKKKGKAKEKEKKGKGKSKAKESKAHPEGTRVEVVITTKPPKVKTKKKEKSDAKTKGNDKDPVKGGGDKDTFKSREFIEDSDEDDPLRLLDGSSSTGDPHASSGAAVKEKDTASSSTSAKLTITIPVVPSPSALPKTVEPDSPLTDLDMPKPKSSKSKNSSGSKKRKSIVDSDLGEEAEEMQKQKHDTPSTSKKRKTDASGKKKEKSGASRKGKAKQIVLSDGEEESFDMDTGESAMQVRVKDAERKKSSKIIVDDEGDDQSDQERLKVDQQERSAIPKHTDKSTKENAAPPLSKAPVVATPKPSSKSIPLNNDGTTPLYARYEIAPRRSSLPMSELIRRANSMPGSPFSTPHPPSASASGTGSASAKSKLKPLLARTPTSTAYSPYLKSSRSLLSKIAPLHPNRRTPPPPPPPPPPRKKSKKELELEAKWEEEMVEDAGGMEAWAALQDEERKEMRKMKWARELGGWDD